MSNYYTHYWKNKTWEYMMEVLEGRTLAHAGSNLFRSRDVKRGDLVYVVTVIDGELYLGGRIRVDRVLDQQEAEKYTDWGFDIWEMDDHVVMPPDQAGLFHPDNRIPMSIAKELKFISNGETKTILLTEEMKIDRQTLRGVRRLTEKSAKLLDRYLD